MPTDICHGCQAALFCMGGNPKFPYKCHECGGYFVVANKVDAVINSPRSIGLTKLQSNCNFKNHSFRDSYLTLSYCSRHEPW